jgi:Flp pilus assembly protein TadG
LIALSRRLVADRKAGNAIEFALVVPIFLMIVLGIITFGRIMWTLNALQAVGYQTARCVAIASSECATPSSYAIALAGDYGLGDLTAAEVTVTSGSKCNQTTANQYVEVELSYPPYAILTAFLPSFATNLTSTTCYPTTGV